MDGITVKCTFPPKVSVGKVNVCHFACPIANSSCPAHSLPPSPNSPGTGPFWGKCPGRWAHWVPRGDIPSAADRMCNGRPMIVQMKAEELGKGRKCWDIRRRRKEQNADWFQHQFTCISDLLNLIVGKENQIGIFFENMSSFTPNFEK